MKKEYWFILIVYLVMQFSSIFVLIIGAGLGYSREEIEYFTISYWLVISFTLTLILVLFFLRKEFSNPVRFKEAAPIPISIVWGIAGFFMALIAQTIAANIEMYAFGINPGSENTARIMGFIKMAPAVVVIVSIIGPILEEIVFRKIIFGSLNKRLNFFFSALISSVIFSLAHGEPVHTLLYCSIGFTFAFLYVKTKRILVPIIAHVSMNTLVVILQLNIDKIQEFIDKLDAIQSIIGGF
ncbi:CPBP family intramembrane metalloprotease [Bacillaceae bacterium Marseille-Q3522]|nr:CPBP family intramembrane metalloprotease [Bacillaceae bacterium Marseille-Q3522]